MIIFNVIYQDCISNAFIGLKTFILKYPLFSILKQPFGKFFEQLLTGRLLIEIHLIQHEGKTKKSRECIKQTKKTTCVINRLQLHSERGNIEQYTKSNKHMLHLTTTDKTDGVEVLSEPFINTFIVHSGIWMPFGVCDSRMDVLLQSSPQIKSLQSKDILHKPLQNVDGNHHNWWQHTFRYCLV